MKRDCRGKLCIEFPRKGRPVQIDPERRRQLLLDAAEELMAEYGLHRTSMDAIAKRAGMSKRTLYETFDNREALFAECIIRRARTHVRALEPAQRGLPLAARLDLLLTIHWTAGVEARAIEVVRAIVAEVRQFPAIARQVYDDGIATLETLVSDELEAALARGEIPPQALPAGVLAAMLLDMALENPLIRLLDPDRAFTSADCRDARRRNAISIFLRGLGWSGDPA